jgi:hypothetical protein
LDHPERSYADNDGDNALEDEDPRPPGQATYAIHLRDGGGEKTAKGASDGGGGEEDCGPHAEFRAFVPATQIIVHTRKQARLSQTQEPARSGEPRKILHQAHERHAQAPREHDGGDKDRGAEFLEHDLGQGLEDGVGDEENGKGEIILGVCHVEVGLQALDLGVADVGAVEEGD